MLEATLLLLYDLPVQGVKTNFVEHIVGEI